METPFRTAVSWRKPGKGPAFPSSFGITPPGQAVEEKGNAIPPNHPELGDMTGYPFVLSGKTGQPPSFLRMGDSHAMASSPGFDDATRLLQRSGLFYRARLCPLMEDEGQLMYCDDNHLSPYGSRKMVYDIIDQLFPEMESTASNGRELRTGKRPIL